jgi:iron complex transport system substrate-binding protein
MKNFFLILALAAFSFAAPAQGKDPGPRPRIISLYAAHTEILLRLGARDNLVGVSRQETYQGPETEGWTAPPAFAAGDDVEKFLAAKPDLVLLRPMHLANRPLIAALQQAGIKIKALQVLKSGELYQYWRDLGALVGRGGEAENMIGEFDHQTAAYYEAASRRPDREKPGIFLEALHDQIKTFTPDSLPVWLVELAGGRNAAGDARPQAAGLIIADYGPERLLAKAGEVDIFISQSGPMNNAPLDLIKKRRLYQPLRAFKEGRVYKISEAVLARPTPSLLEGLKEISALTGLEVK